MAENRQFLAVYLGSPDSAEMVRWNALSPEERTQRQQAGMAGWNAWVERNQASIVVMGGPLGTTHRVSTAGVAQVHNAMSAFTIVAAPSPEAAAALFEDHPHFAIFPGVAVEIMPIMPVPS
jgi:hypothetical protein